MSHEYLLSGHWSRQNLQLLVVNLLSVEAVRHVKAVSLPGLPTKATTIAATAVCPSCCPSSPIPSGVF